jgi:hypothetical protein
MVPLGTVKRWIDKGFGFIEGEDGNEYFVHWSSITQDGEVAIAGSLFWLKNKTLGDAACSQSV